MSTAEAVAELSVAMAQIYPYVTFRTRDRLRLLIQVIQDGVNAKDVEIGSLRAMVEKLEHDLSTAMAPVVDLPKGEKIEVSEEVKSEIDSSIESKVEEAKEMQEVIKEQVTTETKEESSG